MISQDDIDAFMEQTSVGAAPDVATKKIRSAAEALAYEFHPENLYDLMVLAASLGAYVANERFMQIAYEAHAVWNKEHNE